MTRLHKFIVRTCIVGLLAFAEPLGADAYAESWEVVGSTYNSVAFVDRASFSTAKRVRIVNALRVSGQPQTDGWRSTTQRIRIDCAGRLMGDEGSMVESFDGLKTAYGPTAAVQPVPKRGVFARLYESVCEGRHGQKVADPKAWTLRNFKVGDELP